MVYRTSGGAEYYLAASSQKLMEDWMYALWSNLGKLMRSKESGVSQLAQGTLTKEEQRQNIGQKKTINAKFSDSS